ncbi:MAG: nuclear transport factor 2 family protein [Anaerolineales bacterium]|nr:nuclear transport factor 2 family protein [Chloroflexota bacterium]MBL6979751.1 nuclear transport factor 2 family protein [Anaerolineales bacterium]
MSQYHEVYSFLEQHLQSIMDNDIDAYHASTSSKLTLYEWWVTPHRIDGLNFHDFLMLENERRGAVFGSDVEQTRDTEKPPTRFDLANLHIQDFGDTAIASYTLLLSSGLPEGVSVVSHNESRVMIKRDDKWKVVHVHKSPAWQAPHMQPQNDE